MFDQDLYLNLCYDPKKLIWLVKLNPRVRCAFGNVYHSKQPSYRPIWVIDILVHNRKKAVKRAAESESEDESSEEEEEEAYKPKKGKRGPPSPRKTVEPAPKKKAKAAPAKKPAAKKAAAKPVVAKKSKPPGKGAVNKSRKGASRGKK